MLDLQTPQRSSTGKAVQLLALENIPDLSLFGLGVANNGGGSDGVEVDSLPAVHLRSGSKFWVMHDQ